MEPSKSETWVSSASAGRLSRSTVKPWFIETISTLPVVKSLHRVVGAVMALVHLHGLGAERQAQHLVAEADAEHRLAAGDELLDLRHGVVRRWPPDRRGRWTGRRRRDCARGSPRQWRVAGTTVTLHPDVAEAAQDVALDAVIDGHDVKLGRCILPAVALGPVPLLFVPARSSAPAVTSLARSRPSRPRQALASACSFSRSNLPVGSWAMTPLGMPCSRMRLVSARVSTPARPMMPRASATDRDARGAR